MSVTVCETGTPVVELAVTLYWYVPGAAYRMRLSPTPEPQPFASSSTQLSNASAGRRRVLRRNNNKNAGASRQAAKTFLRRNESSWAVTGTAVRVLMTAVEVCTPFARVTVAGSREHEVYCAGPCAAQVSATMPEKPLTGVRVSAYLAGMPNWTTALPVAPPLTVSRKLPPCTRLPPCMPLPVSGTRTGDAGSLLVMVSVPARVPVCVGENVTVTEQEEPAFRVTGPQLLATV